MASNVTLPSYCQVLPIKTGTGEVVFEKPGRCDPKVSVFPLIFFEFHTLPFPPFLSISYSRSPISYSLFISCSLESSDSQLCEQE